MKVLRWQEASLESSKGFYKGSRTALKSLRHPYPEIHENQWKSIKIHENVWKPMKIDRKRWKSSDDKKPAWNRANVSIGAAGWTLRLLTSIPRNTWKSIIRFPFIFHDFFNGEGSVGNPESLKTRRFLCIFHDFLNGEGSVEPQNHWKCIDF